MIKQVFKWIKNEPKHADTESSKEKCPKLPKKSRSDSISSISSFTFVSQKTDAATSRTNNGRMAPGMTQRQIESKYKLLSSSDSPPVIREANQ